MVEILYKDLQKVAYEWIVLPALKVMSDILLLPEYKSGGTTLLRPDVFNIGRFLFIPQILFKIFSDKLKGKNGYEFL